MILRPSALVLLIAAFCGTTPSRAFGPAFPWTEALEQGERADREGRRKDAVAAFAEAREAARRLGADDLRYARVLDRIGMNEVAAGRGESALGDLEDALAIRRRLLPADSPELAESLHHVGALLDALGRTEGAEPLLLRALEIRRNAKTDGEKRILADSLVSLAGLCWREKRFAEGDAHEDEALRILESFLGPSSHELGLIWRNLGRTHAMKGRGERARRSFLRSMDILKRAVGEKHAEVLTLIEDLMRLDADEGRKEEAVRLGERLVATARSVYGAEDPRVARSILRLADVELSRGREGAAREGVREAIDLLSRAYGRRSPHVARVEKNYAGLLASDPATRREAESGERPCPEKTLLLARRLRDEGMKALEEGNGPKARRLLERGDRLLEPYTGCVGERFLTTYGLAIEARERGALDASWSAYRKALSLYERQFGPDDPALADFLESYASLEQELGRSEASADLRARAAVLRTGIGPGASKGAATAHVRSWLARAAACIASDRWEEGELHLRAAERLARLAGLDDEAARAAGELAFSSVRRNRWDEAELRMARAEDLLRSAHGQRSAELAAFLERVELAHWTRPKGGLPALRLSVAAGRRAWEAGGARRPELVAVLGRWLRRAETEGIEGRWERGELLVKEATDLARLRGLEGIVATCGLFMARLKARRGELGPAAALFRAAEERFAELDGIPSPGWAYARMLRRETLPSSPPPPFAGPLRPGGNSGKDPAWLQLAGAVKFEDPKRCRQAFEALSRGRPDPVDAERIATIAVLRERISQAASDLPSEPEHEVSEAGHAPTTSPERRP